MPPIVIRPLHNRPFERMIAAAADLPGVYSAATVSRAPLAAGTAATVLSPKARLLIRRISLIRNCKSFPRLSLHCANTLKAGRDFTSQTSTTRSWLRSLTKLLPAPCGRVKTRSASGSPAARVGLKAAWNPVWHESSRGCWRRSRVGP